MYTHMLNAVPNRRGWLAERLRRLPFARRFARWWVRQRDVRIADGLGVGLRLNAGQSNPAYAYGTNELPVQRALAQFVRPGFVSYDIGANIGFFTSILCKLVGPTGQVVAFEPLPANAALVRRNLRLNAFENASVIEAAVSAHSGTAQLQVSAYSGGSALATATPPPDMTGLLPVKTVAIDDLVAQGQIKPPALIKIDVEGAEADVLHGLADTVRRHRPVIIYEVDDGSREALAVKQADCEQYLAGFGYTSMRLEDSYPDSGWLVANYLAVPVNT